MAYVDIRNLTVRYDDVEALSDFSIDLNRDDLLAVLGPSGSGKSTLLHAISGLIPIVSGEIIICDRRLHKLPPGKRHIAMVFQDGALFPHLSVQANIELPLKAGRIPKARRKEHVHRIAKLLELETLLGRRPNQISGGEQRRVAMARALIKRPDIFLLDEPLASLDPWLRHKMGQELVELHDRLNVPIIHVTHDQAEALGLGTRIAIINKGRIQQIGSPDDVYDRPKNTFVATFVGHPPMNLLSPSELSPEETNLLFPHGHRPSSADVLLGFRPEDVRVEEGRGFVLQMRQVQGHEQIAVFTAQGKRITARLKRGKPLQQGKTYDLSVPHGPVHVFDANTGNRMGNISP